MTISPRTAASMVFQGAGAPRMDREESLRPDGENSCQFVKFVSPCTDRNCLLLPADCSSTPVLHFHLKTGLPRACDTKVHEWSKGRKSGIRRSKFKVRPPSFLVATPLRWVLCGQIFLAQFQISVR